MSRVPHLFVSRRSLVLACLLPFWASIACAEETVAGAWETYLVFEKNCAECHGGHLAKPKGKLGYILDLPRLVEEDYIFPNEPERSDVFTAMITDDPDMRMPPEDSDGPRPTEAEIETVRQWIAAGARIHPLSPTTAGTPAENVAPARRPAEFSLPRLIGRLHPTIVHFPIALLLCAAAAELGFFLRPSMTWTPGMVRGCVWIGAFGALAAVACGWILADQEGLAGGDTETHRWLGVATAAVAVAILWIHQWSAGRARGRGILLVALLAGAALVVIAGHTGGVLVHGEDYLWKR